MTLGHGRLAYRPVLRTRDRREYRAAVRTLEEHALPFLVREDLQAEHDPGEGAASSGAASIWSILAPAYARKEVWATLAAAGFGGPVAAREEPRGLEERLREWAGVERVEAHRTMGPSGEGESAPQPQDLWQGESASGARKLAKGWSTIALVLFVFYLVRKCAGMVAP